jgi:hypothetical protein
MEEENRNEREPFNDEWLTRALRARSQAEARPGLEERILARLSREHEGKPQRASRWRWMPAVAVALGLLLIVLIGHEFLRVRPHSDQEQTKIPQPTRETRPLDTVPEVAKTQIDKTHKNAPKHFPAAHAASSSHPVLAKVNEFPKLDRFPTETPATEQERLMIEMQRRQSTAALAQYARDFHVIKDLEIERISISPLFSETADAEPNR